MIKASVKVDFITGTEVRDAVQQAKEFAAKLDVAYVNFKFNGVEFLIGRNANVDEAVSAYMRGPIGNSGFVFHS